MKALRQTAAKIASDLRHAARSLRHHPGFTLAVILTLALGLGATIAVFGVFEAVQLSPLPYREPERLVMIWSRWSNFPDHTWVSEAEYWLYRREIQSFASVAVFDLSGASLTGEAAAGEAPEHVNAGIVTPDLLGLLGVEPILGRSFLAEEGTPGRNQVALVGEGLWRRRWGGDPKLVGKAIEIDRERYTVVGILPASFRLPLDFRADAPTEILAPAVIERARADDFPSGGGSHGFFALARLRPGVSVAQARAEMAALNARYNREGKYPPEWHFQTLVVPMPEEVSGAARPALLALLGAVGFVLLTACANVTSLLLARREARGRELAVRTALGASRGDLVRHLLAEGLLLAAAGGAAGLWLADLCLSLLARLPGLGLPRMAEVGIDGRVAGFAFLATALAGLASSLTPALATRQGNLAETLKEGSRGTGAAAPRERLRRTLVAAQVALAVMLTAGAGLMVKSLVHLLANEPGFKSHGVLTLRLMPPQPDYPEPRQVVGFYRELRERVARLPGVTAVGGARRLPLTGDMGDWSFDVQGYTPPPGLRATGDWQIVTPGYLEAVGIPVIAGRGITEADGERGPYVVLVSESLARAYWREGKAVGGRMRLGYDNAPWMTVVGVVADVKHSGLAADARRIWYWPHAQMDATSGGQFTLRTMSLAVRTDKDPGALAGPVRAVVRELDPRLPLADVRTLDEILSASVARPRFTMALFLAFGALALVLAALGIYGVVAYSVARRRREIGIRMAVGARPRDVIGMVMRRAATLAALGLAVGLAATVALSGLLTGLVYGVSPSDPGTLAAVVLLLAATALLAAWLPARRAAALDPLDAIRQE